LLSPPNCIGPQRPNQPLSSSASVARKRGGSLLRAIETLFGVGPATIAQLKERYNPFARLR
jgi:hypothetical protein